MNSAIKKAISHYIAYAQNYDQKVGVAKGRRKDSNLMDAKEKYSFITLPKKNSVACQNQIIMKRIIQFFICAFFFLIPLNGIKSQSDWNLKGTKNGITVYTKEEENTRLNIIRATFEVEATLSQYASIVLNVEDYKSWNYAAKNPYIIKKISETELIYYAEAEAPWPVTDRYVVLHLKIEQHPQSKILEISLNNVPGQIPKKEGFVRIPVYSSVLKVIPVSKNKVKVELILKVDPGGSIPAWLANLVSTKIPITTFSNFKKRVKSQGEHRTSVPEISNK